MRGRALLALGTWTILVGLLACTPRDTVDPATAKANEDLAWLKENKPILDGKRQELRDLRDSIAGKGPESAPAEAAGGETEPAEGEPAEGEPAEGETAEGEAPAPMTPEEMETAAAGLEVEIEGMRDEIALKTANYLNTTGIIVGEALTEDQRYVLDVKIDEDIYTAQEYIERGGDYRRAIDIYNQALPLDPENATLKEAIARAESDRWMTEDRFRQVKKGQTRDQVREILGTPMRDNVRDYREDSPSRPVIAWFYRKEGTDTSPGGASGIFFREKKKGSDDWRVYETDFNAVKQQVKDSDG